MPDDIDYEVIKSIDIALGDSLPYNFRYGSVAKINDTLVFFGLTEDDRSLFIFSLDKPAYMRKIVVDKQERNFVTAAFFVHNQDSIFLLDDSRNKILLVNSLGRIQNDYQLNSLIEKSKTVGWLDGSVFFYNSKMKRFEIGAAPDLEDTDEEYFNHGFVIHIDIDGEYSTDLLGDYPKSYHSSDGFFSGSIPKIDFFPQDSTYLHSFTNDDGLYTCDSNFEKSRLLFNVLSRHTSIDLKLKRDHTSQEQSNYIAEAGLNVRTLITLDKSHYYKIVKHSQPLKDEMGLINTYFQAPWSIIYLNPLNYKKAYEAKMPASIYRFPHIYLLDDNTLLVSRENSFNNKSNDENSLEFDVIKIRI